MKSKQLLWLLAKNSLLISLIVISLSLPVMAKHLINDVEYKNADNSYNMVVEIPAGQTKKWEVDKQKGKIQADLKNGKPRIVDYLAYPGNYGFVPQTLSGDKDPIDVIVLAPTAKRGSILKIKIIGGLNFLDRGDKDYKLIALPVSIGFNEVNDISELFMKYPGTVEILRTWFKNYKGAKKMFFKGYLNSKEARNLIEKAHRNWK